MPSLLDPAACRHVLLLEASQALSQEELTEAGTRIGDRIASAVRKREKELGRAPGTDYQALEDDLLQLCQSKDWRVRGIADSAYGRLKERRKSAVTPAPRV